MAQRVRNPSTCSVGDLGSLPGLERSPGGGNGNPLQDSCLENSVAGYSLWGQLDMTEQLSFSPLISNVMIVSGDQRRDSAIHTHLSTLPQLPFPPGCQDLILLLPILFDSSLTKTDYFPCGLPFLVKRKYM